MAGASVPKIGFRKRVSSLSSFFLSHWISAAKNTTVTVDFLAPPCQCAFALYGTPTCYLHRLCCVLNVLWQSDAAPFNSASAAPVVRWTHCRWPSPLSPYLITVATGWFQCICKLPFLFVWRRTLSFSAPHSAVIIFSTWRWGDGALGRQPQPHLTSSLFTSPHPGARAREWMSVRSLVAVVLQFDLKCFSLLKPVCFLQCMTFVQTHLLLNVITGAQRRIFSVCEVPFLFCLN